MSKESFVAVYNRLYAERQRAIGEFFGPIDPTALSIVDFMAERLAERLSNPPPTPLSNTDLQIQSRMLDRLFDTLDKHPQLLDQIPPDQAALYRQLRPERCPIKSE